MMSDFLSTGTYYKDHLTYFSSISAPFKALHCED